ncbi:UNVERIFIED_CONTAM: hypothetical protein ABID98_003939 [Brevibacillus sp. OAP136]
MKKKTLLTIGVVSFALAGGCFYAATHYLDELAREKLYAPVVKVVAGREIMPFEPITSDDVVIEQEEVDEILPDSYRRIEDVLGKRSVQPIFAGEQLLKRKLEDNQLLPGPQKARYEFPLTMMMPTTEVRKGDYVKIWVKYKSPAELQLMPAPVTFTKNSQSAELLFEGQLATVKDSNGIEIYTLKPSILSKADQIENPFFHAAEATKPLESERRYRDYRAEPSAIPAFIGFNLTDKEYVMLTEAMQYGVIQIGTYLNAKGEKAL